MRYIINKIKNICIDKTSNKLANKNQKIIVFK